MAVVISKINQVLLKKINKFARVAMVTLAEFRLLIAVGRGRLLSGSGAETYVHANNQRNEYYT